MDNWQTACDTSGQLSVVWSNRSFAVARPTRAWIAWHVRPEWQEPNPVAEFQIFGFSPRPRRVEPVHPDSGRSTIRGGSKPMITPEGLAGLADACPGVGWSFHLDSINNPRIKRVYVTVPYGPGNATGGLLLEPALACQDRHPASATRPPPGRAMSTSST